MSHVLHVEIYEVDSDYKTGKGLFEVTIQVGEGDSAMSLEQAYDRDKQKALDAAWQKLRSHTETIDHTDSAST